MKNVFAAVLLLITLVPAQAQSFYSVRRDRTLIFSAGTGTSTYWGELANKGDYLDAKPNVNLGLQAFLGSRVSARAEINWFQLSGDDAQATGGGREFRNLSFQSNNYEISLTGAVHLFPLGVRYYQRPAINFYGFTGIGILYFNPTAELNGARYALQPLMTENVKYSRTQPVIPYGLGVKIKAGPFFNFVIEGANRLTFTDYLDDVSTVHQDKTTWTDPIRIALSDRGPEAGVKPAAPGAIRGNPKTNDGYFLLNVKIEYYLPANVSFGGSRKLYNQKRRNMYRRPKGR